MESKYYKLSVILLISSLAGILLHRSWMKSPSRTINKVVKSSKYFALSPYIVAQSKAETANFTSRLFREHNNLFGMKNALKREQSGFKIEGSVFRAYESPVSSILDYLALLNSTKFPVSVNSLEQFARELKDRGYYEESQDLYLKLLKKYHNG